MNRKIRVGIVGSSQYTEYMHISTLAGYPNVQLTSICSRNRENAEKMATQYHISGVFTDYREMISRGDLDAVIVAAPDDLHYEITIQALEAGCHVLCEKPLAMNTDQALAMLKKAEKAGVIHMVVFTYRWMPFFRYVKDLLDQGAIGRIFHCEFRYLMGGGRNNTSYRWRIDRKRCNGVLGDMGSHMIDLAQWLVGDISRVSARLGYPKAQFGVNNEKIEPANDSALLLTEFKNGAEGLMYVSSISYIADRFMQQQGYFYGESGSLEIDIPYMGENSGAIIRYAARRGERFQILEVPDHYWGEADRLEPFDIFQKQPVGPRSFVEAILNDHPGKPDFHDGFKTQQVIDAALEAHDSGKWVAISRETGINSG